MRRMAAPVGWRWVAAQRLRQKPCGTVGEVSYSHSHCAAGCASHFHRAGIRYVPSEDNGTIEEGSGHPATAGCTPPLQDAPFECVAGHVVLDMQDVGMMPKDGPLEQWRYGDESAELVASAGLPKILM